VRSRSSGDMIGHEKKYIDIITSIYTVISPIITHEPHDGFALILDWELGRTTEMFLASLVLN